MASMYIHFDGLVYFRRVLLLYNNVIKLNIGLFKCISQLLMMRVQ
jgi:hypothetical protein